MRCPTEYCRVIALPVFHGDEIESYLKDDYCMADVLAVIPRSLFHHLHHRIDFFREVHPREETDFVNTSNMKYPDTIQISIWINIHFRREHRTPRDVVDCFIAWAVSTFEDVTKFNVDAFERVFPVQYRTLESKEYMFHC